MPAKRSTSSATVPAICASCGVTFPYRRHRLKERPNARTYCSRICWKAKTPPPLIVFSEDGLTALLPLLAQDGTIQMHALIDAADATWAGQWTWRLSGTYAARSERVNGTKIGIILHRELLGLVAGDGLDGDHFNRDRLDDRRSNLRVISRAGNTQNRPSVKGSSSAYRGVSWFKRLKKWKAEVRAGDKLHYLGLFIDELEAAEAARAARARLLPYATD